MKSRCPSAKPLDGSEDVVSALGPRERLGCVIVVADELGDDGFQSCNTAVDAPLDLARGQEREEALDLVEPRGSGRRQVNMPVGPLGEPVAYELGLVGGVIVHDDMNLKITRHGSLDPIEESAELG